MFEGVLSKMCGDVKIINCVGVKTIMCDGGVCKMCVCVISLIYKLLLAEV